VTGTRVARRYAKALVGLAREERDLDRVREKLKELVAVMEGNRSLRSILYGRSVQESVKQELMGKILDRLDFPPLLRSFVALLVKRDRLRFLALIENFFSRYADELQNRIRVDVVTAADLTAAETKSLVDRLSERTGKTVFLQVQRDPQLIGGLQVRIGGTVLDGSVRAQLAALKENFN